MLRSCYRHSCDKVRKDIAISTRNPLAHSKRRTGGHLSRVTLTETTAVLLDSISLCGTERMLCYMPVTITNWLHNNEQCLFGVCFSWLLLLWLRYMPVCVCEFVLFTIKSTAEETNTAPHIPHRNAWSTCRLCARRRMCCKEGDERKKSMCKHHALQMLI